MTSPGHMTADVYKWFESNQFKCYTGCYPKQSKTKWMMNWSQWTHISFLSLIYFLLAIFAFPKYNMDWTKVTTCYFSSALLQISPQCQYLPRSRWAAIHQAGSAWCMLWLNWCFPANNRRIRPYPSDTPQMAISMLLHSEFTNASTPGDSSRDRGKTFSESKTASRTFFCASFLKLAPLLSPPRGVVFPVEHVTVSVEFSVFDWQGHF